MPGEPDELPDASTRARPPSMRARLVARLQRSAAGNALLLAYQCVRSRDTRDAALLRLARPKGLFQPFGTTAEDRYPELFGGAAARLADRADVRLLSFGCSDGAEVFALRRYFPSASIKGLDIDPRRIRRCRQRLQAAGGDPRVAFDVAGSARGEPPDSYDAVFAMAVFRHGDLAHSDLGDGPERCDHLIRFADFERAVGDLAACLRPGGLMVLRFSNFRFGDTAVAAGFKRLLAVAADNGPVYGPDDRLMAGARGDDGIYQKRMEA